VWVYACGLSLVSECKRVDLQLKMRGKEDQSQASGGSHDGSTDCERVQVGLLVRRGVLVSGWVLGMGILWWKEGKKKNYV
jgi:hypothetical protein